MGRKKTLGFIAKLCEKPQKDRTLHSNSKGEDKPLHFVYKITNLVNSKFYIGVHSTSDIEDGYMGSGLVLKNAIQKYGISNFSREILFHCNTRKEAFEKERELVNIDLIKDHLSYNLAFGGSGGTYKSIGKIKRQQLKDEIFVSDAPKVITRNLTKIDPNYKVVFEVTEAGNRTLLANAVKCALDPRLKFNAIFARLLADHTGDIAVALTDLYNYKETQKKAISYLKKMEGTILLGCFGVKKVAWEQADH